MKILLVEDDTSTAEFLSATLTGERYTVDLARDGRTSLELASQWQYDLVLLDVMLPQLNGIVVCKRLRSQSYQMPILLLTAKNSTHDIVKGLDAGADDYLTKPFEPSQLLARIRALLRRSKNPVLSPMLTWGKLTLNSVALQVTYDGREIELKPREYKLLELFLSHPRQTFSRNAIIDRIWTSDNYPTEGAVTNLIKDLRRRLKQEGIVEGVIETVFGIGYRLKSAPDCQTETRQSGIEAIAQATDWFSSTLERRIRLLEEVERAMLTKTLTELQRERARDETHKLVGGLGTFGYGDGVAFVRQIEEILSRKHDTEATGIEDFSRQLASLKQFLSQADSQLPARSAIASVPSLQIASSKQYKPLVSTVDTELTRKPPLATVLVLSDGSTSSNFFSQLLQPKGIKVVYVTKPSKLWNTLFSVSSNLLLLDLDLPEFNGIEFCQEVRFHTDYENLSILAITAQTTPQYLQQLFAAGADDFISKPILGPELVSRVVNRLERLFQRRLSSEESVAPNTDALTQLPNRDCLECHLHQVWRRSLQQKLPLVSILGDIDYFQLYNLCYGYAAGNICLQRVAAALGQCIPSSSMVARYSGKEFAILLPTTNLDSAVSLAQKIQQKIAQLSIVHERSTVSDRVTLSLGIVGTVPRANTSVSALMDTANQALQAAKWRGGNTYCLYPL